MTKAPPLTLAELKEKLDALTPEQLAKPAIWAGDERGGHIRHVWVAPEDELGDGYEDCLARSEIAKQGLEEDYADSRVVVSKGDVWLMVDWP